MGLFGKYSVNGADSGKIHQMYRILSSKTLSEQSHVIEGSQRNILAEAGSGSASRNFSYSEFKRHSFASASVKGRLHDGEVGGPLWGRPS